MIKFIMGDAVFIKGIDRLPTVWPNTSIDEDGYPYPAITESNENK